MLKTPLSLKSFLRLKLHDKQHRRTIVDAAKEAFGRTADWNAVYERLKNEYGFKQRQKPQWDNAVRNLSRNKPLGATGNFLSILYWVYLTDEKAAENVFAVVFGKSVGEACTDAQGMSPSPSSSASPKPPQQWAAAVDNEEVRDDILNAQGLSPGDSSACQEGGDLNPTSPKLELGRPIPPSVFGIPCRLITLDSHEDTIHLLQELAGDFKVLSLDYSVLPRYPDFNPYFADVAHQLSREIAPFSNYPSAYAQTVRSVTPFLSQLDTLKSLRFQTGGRGIASAF